MTRRFLSALAGFIIVILVAGPQAQQAPAFGTPAAVTSNATSSPINGPTQSVNLLVGRSTIVDIGSTIARVSLTVPDVADAMVTAPTQLLIHGKQPGTISMFIWDRMGGIRTYEVVVRRDLSALSDHVRQLFPGETITVAGSGKDVILSGTVSSKYVMDKAADVAAGYVEKKENVVNLLQQAEGVASNQVLLKVRFAEVSRSALQELGATLFTEGNNNLFGRTTTQQFAAPYFDKNHPSAWIGDVSIFSDYLNLFLFDAKNKVGAVVRALQGKGVFQSLAEPNLIALNGKEASFLAGGEFPYPVPQGNFGSFTIHFKEYGVRLNFTPTVLGGDLINLKIRPEVSSLDFNNAIVIEGFRIPAITARRAETEVELQDGQTFAIAGLLNNTALSSMRKVPGLGDIPILGQLFRSRAYQKDQTELVVMVTPQIVRRGSMGASQGLPDLAEPFLGPNPKPIRPPAPYNGSPHPQNSRAATAAPANQPNPNTATPAQQVPPAQELSMPGQLVQVPAMQPQAPATVQPQPVTATVPEPVPSTPISAPAQLPLASPGQVPPTDPAAEAAAAPIDSKAIEADRKRLAEEREHQKKAEKGAEKQRADEQRKQAELEWKEDEKARAEARKQEEQRRKAEKLEKARAKQQAEADRKTAEDARKRAEEEAKREKSLSEAAARLKQAQAAYEAELSKKGGRK